MNRNKRIIDCTPAEIIAIGKKLIDYFYEKGKNIEEDKDFKVIEDV